jgi:protoporphyrinogen oxidase
MKIGILGGGLTGLTIAANLKNRDFELFEKEKECGGLCRSFQQEGLTFDYGGRILSSPATGPR